MNAIGPQNVVTHAVRSPTVNNIKLRTRRILIPKFAAYLSPKRRALSGLIKSTDATKPIKIVDEKNGNCVDDTPPNVPNPQMTYEWTPSAVAKKLSSDIADDVR